MSLLDSAIAFAATAHAGQVRRYDGRPYIVHPIEVMSILHKNYILDEDVLVTAILHDVVEDTPVGIETIIRRFGPLVGLWVAELTDQFVGPEHGNRAERKAKEADRLSRISPQAQTVKYADLISNTSSIAKHDPRFAKTYLKEKAAILAVMRGGNSLMLALAEESLAKARALRPT